MGGGSYLVNVLHGLVEGILLMAGEELQAALGGGDWLRCATSYWLK
jgi:hypothetical protein